MTIAALIVGANTPPHCVQGIVASCLQTLQLQAKQQHPSIGISLCVVSSCVLPPLLQVLSAGGYSKRTGGSSTVDLSALQLVFLLFNLVSSDQQKTGLLHVVLPPICRLLSVSDASSPHALLCGKGITHIARTSPQVFRGEIMLLPEGDRAILQNTMRAVLESMSQGDGAGSSASPGGANQQGTGGSGGFKKIDMSKYKGGS